MTKRTTPAKPTSNSTNITLTIEGPEHVLTEITKIVVATISAAVPKGARVEIDDRTRLL